jgi:integrase
LLKKIRILMKFAIARGLRTDDPTSGIKRHADGAGHHTWTEDEISVFKARWPPSTCERTAFALLLYTGQRRSDLVRITWPDIVDGRIGVQPRKTERTSGVRLRTRFHPNLAAALEAWPRRNVSILATTGHTSLAEVQRYTRDADQVRLGDAAIKRLSVNRSSQT